MAQEKYNGNNVTAIDAATLLNQVQVAAFKHTHQKKGKSSEINHTHSRKVKVHMKV